MAVPKGRPPADRRHDSRTVWTQQSPTRSALVLVGIAAFGLASCGGDSDGTTGPEGITLGDLAGSWTATQFEYSQAQEGPALPAVDLVAEGFTVTLSVESNGSFTLATTDPMAGTVTQTGSMSFDLEAEDFLLIVFDDDPNDELEFFFVLDGDNAFRLLDTTGEAEFDLDDDGNLDAAKINSAWVR